MIPNRPLVDAGGNFLDAKVGANSTIEDFERKRRSNKYVKAIWGEAFPLPNNVAVTGNGSVFVTNDHKKTARIVRPFSLPPAHFI